MHDQMTEFDSHVLHPDILITTSVIKPFTEYAFTKANTLSHCLNPNVTRHHNHITSPFFTTSPYNYLQTVLISAISLYFYIKLSS
jgi:hypothetical protein